MSPQGKHNLSPTSPSRVSVQFNESTRQSQIIPHFNQPEEHLLVSGYGVVHSNWFTNAHMYIASVGRGAQPNKIKNMFMCLFLSISAKLEPLFIMRLWTSN